jgi:hypothetical protein
MMLYACLRQTTAFEEWEIQHWPSWFAPRLIDFAPQRFGPFQGMPIVQKIQVMDDGEIFS